MSVIRPKPPQDPILYTPEAAGFDPLPLERSGFDAVRTRALGHPAVAEPNRLLAAYAANRPGSELFALLAEARRVREAVDRLVVVADAPSLEAVRCVFETCCHPLHNELPRGERGGRPRLSTVEASLDNDAAAAVLDLLESPGQRRQDLLGRFAILVIADPAGTDLAAATSVILHRRNECDPRRDDWPLVACGSAPSVERLLLACAPAAHDWTTMPLPRGLEGGLAPLSTATLLPAAILGADVVRLLEGAAAALTRIVEAPADGNPAVWLGRVGCLAGRPAARIAPLARWYERLRNACGLSSSGPTAWIDGGEPRRDRLVDAAGHLWPARESAPHAAIRLPRLDEHAVGQLLQTLLVATVGCAWDSG
jgi:hypothetical protein